MLILFCNCSFSGKEPYLGKKNDPVLEVHNSGWVPSPGLRLVTDKRILTWDLYNKPGNSGMSDQSLPLVEADFACARQMNPVQPLTTGVWTNDLSNHMSKRLMELSDIVSFHGYTSADGMGEQG